MNNNNNSVVKELGGTITTTMSIADEKKYRKKYAQLGQKLRNLESENDDLVTKYETIKHQLLRLKAEKKILLEVLETICLEDEEQTNPVQPMKRDGIIVPSIPLTTPNADIDQALNVKSTRKYTTSTSSTQKPIKRPRNRSHSPIVHAKQASRANSPSSTTSPSTTSSHSPPRSSLSPLQQRTPTTNSILNDSLGEEEDEEGGGGGGKTPYKVTPPITTSASQYTSNEGIYMKETSNPVFSAPTSINGPILPSISSDRSMFIPPPRSRPFMSYAPAEVQPLYHQPFGSTTDQSSYMPTFQHPIPPPITFHEGRHAYVLPPPVNHHVIQPPASPSDSLYPHLHATQYASAKYPSTSSVPSPNEH